MEFPFSGILLVSDLSPDRSNEPASRSLRVIPWGFASLRDLELEHSKVQSLCKVCTGGADGVDTVVYTSCASQLPLFFFFLLFSKP